MTFPVLMPDISGVHPAPKKLVCLRRPRSFSYLESEFLDIGYCPPQPTMSRPEDILYVDLGLNRLDV